MRSAAACWRGASEYGGGGGRVLQSGGSWHEEVGGGRRTGGEPMTARDAEHLQLCATASVVNLSRCRELERSGFAESLWPVLVLHFLLCR